jgi:DNA-binding transcriptional ArsR family regulator
MTSHGLPREIETVATSHAAELLLHPLRQDILREARTASSAAEIARRMGMPAQKVNYHVRTLVDAGLLVPAGERRRRNLVEKRYRATARSYVLLPHVLGPMSAADTRVADAFSAAHLLQLTTTLQAELGDALAEGREHDVPVPTLSLDAEVRFRSPDQRAAFAQAIQRALTEVIAKFTEPTVGPDGQPAPERPYRLVLGCYPLPRPSPTRHESDPPEEAN